MDRERYQRVRRIFFAAEALEGEEREQHLSDECGVDTELRAEVERLLSLEDHGVTEAFLDPLQFASEVPAPAPTLSVPCQLGHYRVEGEVGRGGMGVIYRAVDERLERPVALKLLTLEPNADLFRELEREARLLAALNHPNVATIYSLEQVDEHSFFSLELVEGFTLSSMIAEGPLSVAETQRYARQMCLGLQAAHDRDIVHLDLKPGNVMVTHEGIVKLLDFGIAKSLADRHTTDGGSRGTLGYMSPEQLQGLEVDARSDLWALGSIVFECLTGERAFRVERYVEAFDQTDSPRWDLLPDSTPPELRALIERCLTPDRDQRIANIQEVRRHLGRQIGATFYHADPTPSGESSIPEPLTRFIGRENEVAQLEDLLSKSRLLTLIGTGGVGKTRLAIQVVRRARARFENDVCFLELAPVRDAEDIPRLAADHLQLRVVGDDFLGELSASLVDQQRLLVLDNCEHVLEAASDFARTLLEVCPHIKVLATSREPLGLQGEATFTVAPLAVVAEAEEDDTLSPSAQLFVDRAQSVAPGFELSPENLAATLQICQRLDGIPLALELAAARLRALSPEDIAQRLEQGFGLLASNQRDVQARQQTLKDTIEWSHRLLTDGERVLFRRLSVFVGGWTLGAAEEVCADERIESWMVLDLLTGLINKSLIEVIRPSRSDGDVRYRYLESIREFARERLLEDDPLRVQFEERHGDIYLDLLEDARRQFHTPELPRWMARLSEEESNFSVALQRMKFRGDMARAIRLGGLWWRHWEFKGHYRFGLETLSDLLGASAHVTDQRAMILAHSGAGVMAIKLGQYELAQEHMEEAVDRSRSYDDLEIRANVTSNLGVLHKILGNVDSAIRYYDESLGYCRSINDAVGKSRTLANLGVLKTNTGDYEEARECFEESIALARELGDVEALGSGLQNLMIVHRSNGALEKAKACIDEALEVYQELGSEQRVAITKSNVAIILHDMGKHEEAIEFFRDSYDFESRAGDRTRMASVLISWVSAVLALDRIDEAHERYREAVEHLLATPDPRLCAYAMWCGMTLAAHARKARTAGLFRGTCEAQCSRTNIHMAWLDRQALEHYEEIIRGLDSDSYHEGYQAGLGIDIAEGLEHARRGVDEWS